MKRNGEGYLHGILKRSFDQRHDWTRARFVTVTGIFSANKFSLSAEIWLNRAKKTFYFVCPKARRRTKTWAQRWLDHTI